MQQKYKWRFAILLIVLSSLVSPACKKSSGSSNNGNSSYPFTATLNGSGWSANFISPTDGGPGIASTTISYGVNYVVAFGIQVQNGNDTSIMVIVFPANTPLNTPTDLSPAANTGAAYSVEASPGSSTYNAYGTNTAYGGSGTFTVTEFDQTNKIVAGTFSGTFGSAAGTKISVSNGKFHCKLISSTNSFPPNVKY